MSKLSTPRPKIKREHLVIRNSILIACFIYLIASIPEGETRGRRLGSFGGGRGGFRRTGGSSGGGAGGGEGSDDGNDDGESVPLGATIGSVILFIIVFACCCVRPRLTKSDEYSETTCYLCLKEVPDKQWDDGSHRRLCAVVNSWKLKAMPQSQTESCPKCGDKLRKWPRQGPEFFYCEDPGCGINVAIRNNGSNRFNCFKCDYDVCLECMIRNRNKPRALALVHPIRVAPQNGNVPNGLSPTYKQATKNDLPQVV